MKSRFKYRIYPTLPQQTHLARLFGCCRVVFNDALARCKQTKTYKVAECQKICITQAKQTPERAWLVEVSNIPLQQAIRDLGSAFKSFFDSKKSKRRGRTIGYPRFKKKRSAQSARFTRGGFSIQKQGVYLAKIGTIKTKWSRPLPSEASSVTVIKDCANRYFLSFVVETKPVDILATAQAVGVDLGVQTFAALSTGEKIQGPDSGRLDRRIRRAQRVLCRRQKGSKRRERARLRVAKLQAKLADIRCDFLHKLSTRLLIEHASVFLEDLDVSDMLKNRRLSRLVSRSGFYRFRQLCEAKAEKFQRGFEVIDRYAPTSQVCADCGYRWGKLDLSQRSIVCLGCLRRQDRDLNAAQNIRNVGAGHAQTQNGRGSAYKTPLGAQRDEPSTWVRPEQLSLNLV